MSGSPTRCSIRASAACNAGVLRTSATRSQSEPMSRATSRPATIAPASLSLRTIAAPMPLAAPVTSAIRPCSSRDT